MTRVEKIFLKDSYAKEITAIVTKANQDGTIELDRTIFYPTGGGQPCDLGTINGLNVTEVRKNGDAITHKVEGTLKTGDAANCKLDWDRRHKIMRMHTAAHVIGAAMHANGWLITGNQLGPEESRIDFSMEAFDRAKFDEIIAKANANIATNAQVKAYELPREEALAIPGVIKLANALPPEITSLRIVEITGIDTQADGGTHVANTSEIGKVEITKLENKGSKNKRVYFRLA